MCVQYGFFVVHHSCVLSFAVVKRKHFTYSNYKQRVLMMSKPKSVVWRFHWWHSENVCVIQILKCVQLFVARLFFLHLLFSIIHFWYNLASLISGISSCRVFNFKQISLFFPVTAVRVVSPKSPHNFKGCLCLWTHKGLSKPRLYHFLFTFVYPSSLAPVALVFLLAYFFTLSVWLFNVTTHLSAKQLFPSCFCVSLRLTVNLCIYPFTKS